MRLNNLSARLIVNKKFQELGMEPLSSDLPYLEYATHLRKIIARKSVQVEFVSRPDAVAYVRWAASNINYWAPNAASST